MFALLGIAAAVGVVFALSGGDGDGDVESAGAENTNSTSATDDPGTTEGGGPDTTEGGGDTTATTEDEPEGPAVQLNEVTLEGGQFVTDHETIGYTPSDSGSDALHIHFFPDTVDPDDAGTNGTGGVWEVSYAASSFTLEELTPDSSAMDGADQLCAVVADIAHAVFDPDSGNCVDLP